MYSIKFGELKYVLYTYYGWFKILLPLIAWYIVKPFEDTYYQYKTFTFILFGIYTIITSIFVWVIISKGWNPASTTVKLPTGKFTIRIMVHAHIMDSGHYVLEAHLPGCALVWLKTDL